MRRWRIYVWQDGSFWTAPAVYTKGRTSREVRARLARSLGDEIAAKSCVTAYCDVTEGLHPKHEARR